MSFAALLRLVLVSAMIAAGSALFPSSAALAQGDDLTQTYLNPGDQVAFAYPADWVLEPFFVPGIAFVANSQAAHSITETEGPVPDGMIMVVMMTPEGIEGVFGQVPTSLQDGFNILLEEQEDPAWFAPPSAVSFGTHEALQSFGETPVGESFLLAINVGGQVVLATITTAPGEYARFAPTVLAMLASLGIGAPTPTSGAPTGGESAADDPAPTATPAATPTPPATATPVPEGALDITYPDGWQAFEAFPGARIIHSAAVSDDLVGEVQPGIATIYLATPVALFGNYDMAARAAGAGLPLDTVGDLVTAFAQIWVAGEGLALADLDTFAVVDYDAARIDFTTATNEGFVLGIDHDGEWLILHVTAAPGELADFERTVLQMAKSIAYTPPN